MRCVDRDQVSVFQEDDSAFYDQEYFLNLEARYLSGATNSRTKNIIASCGEIAGKRVLELGCGGGFMAREFALRGAQVTGIDYAEAGIRFGKRRYPELDLRTGSAYELTSTFAAGTFDIVTLLDVIEHMSDHEKLLDNIRYVLKPGGRLIISTDEDDSIWTKGLWMRLFQASTRFSADGRAMRHINRVENRRANRPPYNLSHINSIGLHSLDKLLRRHEFNVIACCVYPMVGVPIRDSILKFFPMRWRGEHQCVSAEKT
jgi:2-polyprenyl-3-methyl-5-hydroxy-6-metoxy-1,4-benzoquinol methylase